MADELSLVKPSEEWRQTYMEFYQDWKDSGESMVPWAIEKDPSDFPGMLRFLAEQEKGEHIPESWVPSSTFWLIADGKSVVGAVNIRHRLNEKLLREGGHIGYGIRPSERGKGYAAKMLALALERCRELGIEKALVVCDASNTASECTILKNGGIADADFIEEDGNVVKRYWIEV
ncbi:GNAT family N-acetyltransferase [Gorillibacterium massiliense]|uniref:GNAT family N-acetyltransferase n=1 Tax=Gorillibacterium massiliense TaxID=1280390 RepID=UPI0004B6B37E|nr:GNAT family N-acetyltransferase [Gorillibacterium massiliense]